MSDATLLLTLLPLVLATLGGCTSLRSNQRKIATAGQLGCSPEEVTLDENKDVSPWVYRALCRGQEMICSEEAGYDVNTHCALERMRSQ